MASRPVVDVVIRDVAPGDADTLIRDMRECDRLEVKASAGGLWEHVLRVGLRTSLYSKTITGDGELAAIFGVAPASLVDGVGRPWLLATDVFDRHPRAVIRHCRRYIDPMLDTFPHLVNYVDARNTKTIAWLAWLGFTMHDPEPHGPYGMPFLKFEKRR